MGSVCLGDTLSCMGCVKRKSLDPSCPLGNQCGYLLYSHVPPIGNARCVRLQGVHGIYGILKRVLSEVTYNS